MPRMWYLSRDGNVFGPVTDEQLMQSVAAGRVQPNDQLNVAGEPNWQLASAIPGLLPQPKPAPVLAPAPAPASAEQEVLSLDAEPEVLSLEPLSLEPVVADLLPIEPAVVATRSVRMTCFACFREVAIEVTPGVPTAHCPKCGAAVETGESAEAAPPANANQAAFAALESPNAFKERMQKKVAEAQAAANRDGAILGAVLGSVIPR